MVQKTVVLKVPKAGHAALRDRLAGGDFEFRPVPHSVFSAKGAGVIATLYNSGKFVVQGQNPELFLAQFTDLEAPASGQPSQTRSASEATDRIAAVTGPVIGSDETGKGDYFGPLVVCAAKLDPREARELTASGVMDSKQLTDTRAMQLGALLRAKIPYALRVLDPIEYNAAHEKLKNVNMILAGLHAAAIRELAELADPGVRVVVDQFAPKKRMEEALRGLGVKLEQAPRAERNPAVAAASILARQEFLVRMLELSREFGVDLRKGAGTPVDAAGARFAKEHGAEALGKVAKLHFKNTQKVMARLR